MLEHRARCATFDAVTRVVRVGRTLAHGRGFHGNLVEVVELLAFIELVFVFVFKLVLHVLYVLIAVALVCCIFGARRVKGTEVRFGEGVASGVGHCLTQLSASACESPAGTCLAAALPAATFLAGAFLAGAFLAGVVERPGRAWRSETCLGGRLDSNCSQAPEITSNLRTVSVG